MLLSGVQRTNLDSRLKHAGMTDLTEGEKEEWIVGKKQIGIVE